MKVWKRLRQLLFGPAATIEEELADDEETTKVMGFRLQSKEAETLFDQVTEEHTKSHTELSEELRRMILEAKRKH